MEDITLETLLLNWFANTCMNHENNAVLLIAAHNEFNADGMTNLLKKSESQLACYVNNLNYLKYDSNPFTDFRANLYVKQNLDNYPAKNFIFYVNNDKSNSKKMKLLIESCRKHKKQILFTNTHHAFYALQTYQNDKRVPIELPKNSNCYLDVYASDPVNLVKNETFRQNIMDIVQHRVEFMRVLFSQSIYLNEQINNKIHYDIELLKNTNLLTSNLALHLYQLTFFKIETNPTEAGIYFRDRLGTKSKTFSKSSKRLKNVLVGALKPFKAYDLSIDIEKQINLDFASKLIQFIKSNPNKVLDTYSIATITDTSVEEVEEIFDVLQTDKITRPL